MRPLASVNELTRDVERFLFVEAGLLDDRAFSAWLELFATSSRYVVRIRTVGDTGAKSGPRAALDTLTLCDDSREFLAHRVARLERDLSACERPPSLTRRLISNVVVDPLDDRRVEARSNFMVFQTRVSEALLVGSRRDALAVLDDGVFSIESREVILDHSILPRTLTALL